MLRHRYGKAPTLNEINTIQQEGSAVPLLPSLCTPSLSPTTAGSWQHQLSQRVIFCFHSSPLFSPLLLLSPAMLLQLPIRAPLFSFCVTIISVICELAFLTASLTFIRYTTCVQLKKSKRINIRAQHRRVLAVTIFAMLAFVALETLTSVFTDPITRTVVDLHPCVRNVFAFNGDEAPFLSESIHFKCTRTNSTEVAHFEGNFSNITKEITCAPQPIYTYVIGDEVTLPRENATIHCEFNVCAFSDFRNNTLLISGLHKRTDQEIIFVPARVNPNNTAQIDLASIAASLAMSYEKGSIEVGEVLRMALLGSLNADECPFERDAGPATTIPIAVIVSAGLVWASSLLFFFASLCFRRRIFFDITHPMHWARRARHDHSRAMGDDPELHMMEVDGEISITVTGYMKNRDL